MRHNYDHVTAQAFPSYNFLPTFVQTLCILYACVLNVCVLVGIYYNYALQSQYSSITMGHILETVSHQHDQARSEQSRI